MMDDFIDRNDENRRDHEIENAAKEPPEEVSMHVFEMLAQFFLPDIGFCEIVVEFVAVIKSLPLHLFFLFSVHGVIVQKEPFHFFHAQFLIERERGIQIFF